MDNVFEKKISSFLATGLYLITIIVIAGPVSDPVNVPKLAALGLFSFGAIPYLIYNLTRKQAIVNHKIMISIILLFNIILILVTVLSGAPTSQNIYGMYGRNTGLITYVSFSCILASIALFQEKKSIEKILIGFFAAGCTNLIYGLIEHFIGDPFPWKNNYGALLGTFGNPDFAGAFYGLLAGMLFAFILSEGISNSSRNIATLLFSI